MEKRHFICTSSSSDIPGSRDNAFNDFSRLLTVAMLDVDVELTSKLKDTHFKGACHTTLWKMTPHMYFSLILPQLYLF